MANEAQPQAVDQMDDGQLAAALADVEAQEDVVSEEVTVEVPATDEVVGETEETEEEVATEDDAETSSEQTEDDTPEYLKDTPYKTPEELAKGYSNLSKLIGEQGRKMGELQRAAEESRVRREETPLTPRQPEDFDPTDPDQVQAEIDRRVNQQVQNALKPFQSQMEASAGEAEEAKWRIEADKLAVKHPEYKVDGDLDNLLDIITQCRSTGQDPIAINPECQKVLDLSELVTIVKRSNGSVKSLDEALALKTFRNGGFEEKILSARQSATKETINKINGKRTGAKTLAKAGGKAAPTRKTLTELSDEELNDLVARTADAEETEWEDQHMRF